MNVTSSLLLCAMLTVPGAAGKEPTLYDFEGDEPGAVPAGFSPALSGQGRPGVWQVLEDAGAPSGSRVVAQTDGDGTSYRFPVLVVGGTSAFPGELSGGEQQRVALARALVQEPAALLLDEPFSSLDVALKAELIGLFRSLLRENRLSTLLVAHDPREALALGERIVVLESGRVSAAGSVDELHEHPRRSRFLAAFLAGAGGVRRR